MVENGNLDPFLADSETPGPHGRGGTFCTGINEQVRSLQYMNVYYSVLLRAAAKLLIHL